MKVIVPKRYLMWMLLVLTVTACFYAYGQWKHNYRTDVIQAMSWAVAGHTYVIDPGHGGEDPGKVGPNDLYEKDINLAVAKKLHVILSQGGGQVVLTRDSDISLSSGQDTVRERKRADLAKRVEIAKNAKADIFISLHCNAFPASRWSGAQTFYSPSVPGSKELAEFIQEELASQLGNTTRKAKSDTTSVIMKQATMPIVNVEMGFLSNPREAALLQDPAYQDKLAWAIYSGIVRYLVEYGDSYRPTWQRAADK